MNARNPFENLHFGNDKTPGTSTHLFGYGYKPKTALPSDQLFLIGFYHIWRYGDEYGADRVIIDFKDLPERRLLLPR
ncbi:MAG: hypothetical protein IPO07_20525 [Haliscomenobacter sp.]|nr:hypothetical protein [Haliscomenobacter sp.]MBK9490900.1 hypothetical protein [Haliscomenobacter sp.]